MNGLFIYILQANLLLSLIFLGYYFLLRKLTFYKLNRAYFLFGGAYAFFYPFIEFKSFMPLHETSAVPVEFYEAFFTQEIILDNGFALLDVLLYALCGVGVYFILRFLKRLYSIYVVHQNSYKEWWEGFFYREVYFPIQPFSFLKNIYVHQKQHVQKELYTIFKHENHHVKGLHSLDILMFELLLAICWYNPFVWLMRIAVRQNLEYLTDHQVLERGVNRQTYQYALVRMAQEQQSYPQGNSFSVKPLKNRIMMMNKKRSTKFQLGKYLFLLPLLIFIGAGCTVSKAENKIDQLTDKVQQTKVKDPFENSEKEGVQKEEYPLAIIDGKEVSQETLQALDPKKIEAINVLKDKAALDKYGAKAKHGVIEVTLKEGSENHQLEKNDFSQKMEGVLYVVDGKETTAEEIRNINSEQIESIEVFKDKKHTARYEESGENGVVEIKLKKD